MVEWGKDFIDDNLQRPPRVFYKNGSLKNFVKFTAKYLSRSLFFNKLAGLMPATLLKKRIFHEKRVIFIIVKEVTKKLKHCVNNNSNLKKL